MRVDCIKNTCVYELTVCFCASLSNILALSFSLSENTHFYQVAVFLEVGYCLFSLLVGKCHIHANFVFGLCACFLL